MKKTKQKIYVRRRIVCIALVLLMVLLIFFNIKNKNKIQKIALGGNALYIAGEQIDISRVISSEPNAPTLGAGMIPIKWNATAEMWQITTASDTEWYNYANGKWANVMLSDGVYQSELQADMANKKLAEINIGAQIREEELGSIFTWVPRLAYLEDRVEFLKNTSILEYMWTTESCFNLEKYGANYLDLAFTGIWVGQKEFANITELENKNAQMQLEENIEGLIANEKVTSLTNSEKTAVQKLKEKYSIIENVTMLENIDTMQYRQIIKVVNTNNRLPIMGTHVVISEGIVIRDKYSEYGIKYVVDKNGNRLEKNIAVLEED